MVTNLVSDVIGELNHGGIKTVSWLEFKSYK